MVKKISSVLAAFLIFGLISGGAQGATATAPANSQTIGGYIYSWFDWIIAVPKTILLGVDSEIVKARADLISDIKGLKAVIERTGFQVDSISVGMELIPTVALSLSFNQEISDQEKEQLSAELQSGKFNILERALIDALLEAASVRIGGEGDNLVLTGAEIEVDIVPGITLVFEEAESATATK